MRTPWNLIVRGWEIISHFALAHWIWTIALPAVPSFGIAWWAAIRDLPLPVVAALAVLVFCVLFLTALALIGSRPAEPKQHPLAITPSATPVKRPAERIPLTTFREWAADAGWNDDIFAFADAVRQAGVDGELAFWGRKYVYDLGRDHDDAPLVRIPKGHFDEFGFDVEGLADAPDNYDIFTTKLGHSPNDFRGSNYRDIHVAAVQAKAWLGSEMVDERIRRERLLAQARKFVARTVVEKPADGDYFKKRLETDTAFLALRPLLSKDFLGKVTAQRIIFVPRDGTNMPALADWYVEELDRIEGELP